MSPLQLVIYIKNHEPTEKGPIPGSGVYCRDKYVVYILNSGYYSTYCQIYSHGKLGKEQYDWLRDILPRYKSIAKWHILMLHHHPFKYSFPNLTEDISCLEEGSELVDIIGNSQIDLVCHGHRHHPTLFTQMRDNWESPITFFCAGSLSVHEKHREHGRIPNLFHLINLQNREDSENQAATGTVKSFEYLPMKGWIPLNDSLFVPLDPKQFFGSINSLDEKERSASTIITDLLRGNTVTYVELPKHHDLPLSLKCMPLKDLNSLIKKIVSQTGKYKIMGKYPDNDIIIMKI